MPSVAAHFVCAKLVLRQCKNINRKDFYIGCILPDIIDKSNSHFKIDGKYYKIPDIDYYRNNVDISKDINKGYLCHLLLDKYFLEDYVLNRIKDYDKINLFTKEILYNEYTRMNYLLVEKYKLNVNYINKILDSIDIELKMDSYEFNIKCLQSRRKGKLKYINFNDFCEFLEKVSIIIADEIMR